MSQVMKPFDLGDIIKKKLSDKSLMKTDKTKLKLMLGTVKMLKKKTFKQLRIADICKAAKVSYGVFYHYHKDKTELSALLIEMFIEEFNSNFISSKNTEDNYFNIFSTNYYYIGCFKLNAGLMQVMISNHEDMPELIDKYNNLAHTWHSRVAKSLSTQFAGHEITEDEKMFIAYSLGGMLDEILRQINILKNPHLKVFEENKSLSQMTQLLSILWYRSVFGENPSLEDQKRVMLLV